MSTLRDFTPAEAAFVLGEHPDTIKKALDTGPVQARITMKSGRSVRAIDRGDLVFLYAARVLKNELTPTARRKFYTAFKQSGAVASETVQFGSITIAVLPFWNEIEARERDLLTLEGKVEFGRQGEPMLKGTQVEVYRVAALLDGGMTVAEILSDYPTLDESQVIAAKNYAAARPKTGRPYPSSTFKSAARKGGLEALDAFDDET